MRSQIEIPTLGATKMLHFVELTMETSKSRHQLLPATFQSLVTQEKTPELIISLFYIAGTMPNQKAPPSYSQNKITYINKLDKYFS